MTMKDYSTYFEGKDWVHQLGFCAPDWRAFMTAHNRLFGSGPFFYTTNTFGKLLYHGEEVDCKGLEFHACYGAWGSHSIEVVTQNDWSIPTMFTELNKEEEPGLNHVHIFVDSLAEAQDACDFLGIDVITVGYPDLENALEKARATGTDEAMVRANAGKPSFMVADMRKDLALPCSSSSRVPRTSTMPSSALARSGTVRKRRCSFPWAEGDFPVLAGGCLGSSGR